MRANIVVLFGGMLLLFCVPAWAEEPAKDQPDAAPVPSAPASPSPSVTGGLETGVLSTYVDRAVPQYLEKFHPTSQTNCFLSVRDLGAGTLTLGMWTAVALAEHDRQPGNGVDMKPGVSYAFSIVDNLAASVGYTATLLPESVRIDAGHELSASVSVPNVFVTPFLLGAVDAAGAHAGYAALGLNRQFQLGSVTITPSTQIGVQGSDALSFDMQDSTTTLAVAYSPLPGMYFKVSGIYAALLRSDAEQRSFTDRSTVAGGLAAGYAP